MKVNIKYTNPFSLLLQPSGRTSADVGLCHLDSYLANHCKHRTYDIYQCHKQQQQQPFNGHLSGTTPQPG